MISYFKNRCPSCNHAPIFSGIYVMNSKCPACETVFEKESGYFIGAMIASYFLGVFLALPVLLLLIFYYQVDMGMAIGATILQTFLLQPLLFRYSRILWIQIEHRLTEAIHSTPHSKK